MIIESMFKFDRNVASEKFKEYIDSYKDDGEINYNRTGKQIEYSEFEILDKIRKIYAWVYNHSLLQIRQLYNHDENKFNEIVGKIKTHINNKIKVDDNDKLYINVNNSLKFTGEKFQYEDWVLSDKRKTSKLIKNIVDELNDVLIGDFHENENHKSVLFDNNGKNNIHEEESFKTISEKNKNDWFKKFMNDGYYDLLYEYIDKDEQQIIMIENNIVSELREIFVEEFIKNNNIENDAVEIAESFFTNLKVKTYEMKNNNIAEKKVDEEQKVGV